MDDLKQLADSLRSVRHFKHLPPADLLTIVASGKVRRFASSEVIFSEGDPCAGMYVLISGHVHLFKTGPQGQLNILGEIDPVIMFNEVAVLDGGPNPFSAAALQPCLIWQIEYDVFQNLLTRYPQVGMGLLRVLAKRQRQMLAQYEDLSFRSVLARVAKLLIELSAPGQQPIDRHAYSINVMAAHIASVPEAISRSLNVLTAEGAIQTSRTQIIILSLDKLAEVAQVEPGYSR